MADKGSKSGFVRLLAVPLVAAGFALGLVIAATHLVQGVSPEPFQPTAIVWADRVFATPHQFDVWLRSRGSSYKLWAAHHPTLAQRLKRPPARTASGPRDSGRQLAVAEPQSTRVDTPALPIFILITASLGLLALFVVVRTRVQRPAWSAARKPRLPSMPRRVAVRRPPWVRAKASTLAGLVVHSVTETRSDLGARLAHRRLGSLDRNGETLTAIDRMPIRYVVRKSLPDLAFYATAALLACVLGASIALYLN
jgi:hypothetical protein